MTSDDLAREAGMARPIAAGAEPDAAARAQREAQILHERARAAALPPAVAEDQSELPVVVFELAKETYAIEIRYVVEVFRLRRITALPGTPRHFSGITSRHGWVVPLIDLRTYFGVDAKGLTELDRVVTVGDDKGARIGLLADAILGVRALSTTGLVPALPTHGVGRAGILIGVAATGMSVLDGAKLLADPGLRVEGTLPAAMRGTTGG